jgi:hypothetical protein
MDGGGAYDCGGGDHNGVAGVANTGALDANTGEFRICLDLDVFTSSRNAFNSDMMRCSEVAASFDATRWSSSPDAAATLA